MMGDHQEGFVSLKIMAIDQHVLARNSQFLNYWETVFDKNSAIIVRGIQFEVILMVIQLFMM